MAAQIKDLVTMGDVETLFELMTEDDDWMNQLDAAEGLVQLGDVRGLEFLRSAEQSEDRDARKVAKEILAAPELAARIAELEAVEKREFQAKIDTAKKRLQKGRKVFIYRMVYLSSGELLDQDPSGEGYDVPALTEHGLEGWEVANIVGSAIDNNTPGTFVLLKKEVAPDEGEELDKL